MCTTIKVLATHYIFSFRFNKKLTTSHHVRRIFFISLPPHPKNNIPATLFTGFKINHLQQQITLKKLLYLSTSPHTPIIFSATAIITAKNLFFWNRQGAWPRFEFIPCGRRANHWAAPHPQKLHHTPKLKIYVFLVLIVSFFGNKFTIHKSVQILLDSLVFSRTRY